MTGDLGSDAGRAQSRPSFLPPVDGYPPPPGDPAGPVPQPPAAPAPRRGAPWIIAAIAAVPGALALLVCGIFVLRLGDVRDDLPETGLDLGYQITVRYGWYLAVVASLFVVGFSLARPIGARVARSQAPDQYEYQYTQEQYQPQFAYPDQPGEGAAWPDEDQAWGRRQETAAHPPESEPGPEPRPEPRPDQS
jgi:hypothetical protein